MKQITIKANGCDDCPLCAYEIGIGFACNAQKDEYDKPKLVQIITHFGPTKPRYFPENCPMEDIKE